MPWFNRFFKIAIGWFMCCSICIQALAQTSCMIDSSRIAIRNITVIPMIDTFTVLNHQTVLVQNNTILQIGDTNSVFIPSDAFVISGNGKYLIPGLADMHAHLLQRNDMLLELANGVTTVCNMNGQPWHIGVRDSIQSGLFQLFATKIDAPRLYTSGPIMNFTGHPFFNPPPIQTQTQALASLQQQDSIGYDFYKVYTFLTSGVFNLIQNRSDSTGRAIKGHGNDWLGVSTIIGSKQKCIEHFWGYLPDDTLNSAQQALEDSTIARGKWNCPTLIVRWNQQHLDSLRANEPFEVTYACPSTLLNNWRNATANPQQNSNIREYQKMLKRLYLNGAKLMLGSDNITPYAVAGFAVHRELEIMVEAGLSPHQALSLATSTPHQFLQECGLGNLAGTITVGKRADMLILNQNPLTDIRATRSITGVIGNGTYYSSSCLQSLLSNLVCNSTLSINEIHAHEERLIVYPNPARDELRIEGFPAGKEGRLLVIDQLGKKCIDGPFQPFLRIADLSPGLYYLLAHDGHAYYSQQFVKE